MLKYLIVAISICGSLQADQFRDFLENEVENLNELVDKIKEDCVESYLDIQLLYFVDGQRQEAERIYAEYLKQIKK